MVVGEWGPLNNSLPNMGRFYREAVASLGRYGSGWAGYVWCYGGGYCAVDARQLPYEQSGRRAVRAGRRGHGALRHGRRGGALVPARRPCGSAPAVTERPLLPPSARGWRVRVTGPARVLGRAPHGGPVIVVAWPGAEVVVTVREASHG
ncbi:Glycoside hydrolase family 5 domain-containing protein OS=Streptomyces microflavus OX=1919 GN=Smic_56550 PE=3 SV=1 [Streptomyces microflavus]